jgi:hypothetical protein
VVLKENRMEVVYHLIFLIPTIVEAFEDRKGDAHSNMRDIIIRGVLILVCGTIASVIRAYNVDGFFRGPVVESYILKDIFMSLMYFCAIFQYAVNWSQRKVTERNDWYKHLNKTTIPDKWKWYQNMNWRLRMAGHGLFIVIGLIYYYV